ncbi:MAG TPA: NHLP leader peptide family RiPP precursor [Aggregatilineales bacterium]|nr:NHLP leader peptide family natural product precursor [Anaerolineales bacterium]HRE48868.1 NHLP leader peptide family RiPP precursor [Aggregatilineales bacterium]
MSDARREGEEKVVGRAKKDSAYRAELMANPAAAVASETGWHIPDGVNIKIVEESADTFYLVIPHMPAAESGSDELSDDQLENVAGGNRGRCANVQSWTCVCTG